MWRPDDWETPSTFEAENWVKESLERFKKDRELYSNQADSGELESARLALAKDKSFQHGYEAGADAMFVALRRWQEEDCTEHCNTFPMKRMNCIYCQSELWD